MDFISFLGVRYYRRWLWVMTGVLGADCAHAQEAVDHYADLQFDSRMLWGSGSQADLSRFSRRNILRPGMHPVEVLVNDQRADSMVVKFVPALDKPALKDARACFTQEQLEKLGVNLNALSPLVAAKIARGDCIGVKDIYSDSTESFDFSTGRLAISVPQAYLINRMLQDVSPERWQSGITAFRSNYSYGYSRYQYGDVKSDSFSALFDSGLNVGDWYLRNSSYLAHNGTKSYFKSQRTTLQTDIPSLRARVVMGQLFSSAEYFSSYQLNGVMISTDPAMLPYSERMYRPTVRGIASSMATVRILQAGTVIYQGSVSPGPFSIDDYSPLGYGGDLTVVVTEADGSTRRFIVPFGNAVRLIRKGQIQYSASAGRYNAGSYGADRPWVAQVSGRWGASDGVNLYGGLLNAQGHYNATSLGAAFNTGIGAISGDVTLARARMRRQDSFLGTSYRLSYTKTIEPTRTVVRLATLRYSSRDFYTLNDTLAPVLSSRIGGRPRSEFTVALSQPVGGYGSLYLSGAWRNHWNSSVRRTQWEATYGTSIKRIGVSLTAAYSNDSFGNDRRLMLNVAIPLDGFGGGSTLRGTYLDERGRGSSQRLAYDSTFGEDRSLSYGLDVTKASSQPTAYGANASYTGRYGQIGGNVVKQGSATQLAVNGNGGVVVHAGGATFGHLLPDSIGLIDARDAGGATISNMGNASLDRSGFGLVGLSPYSRNDVQISPENLPLDVELESSQETAIPRAGAVVPLVFKTRREQAALLIVGEAYRDRLPFGTAITDANGKQLGTSGQGGRALLRGLEPEGVLNLTLSDGKECRSPYQLKQDDKSALGGLPAITMKCEEGP